MNEINYQCGCGLCTSTVNDMYSHWKASGHGSYQEVTVERLVNIIKHNLEGLRTFQYKRLSQSVKSE